MSNEIINTGSKRATMNRPAVRWSGRWMGIPELVSEIRNDLNGKATIILETAKTNPVQQTFSKSEGEGCSDGLHQETRSNMS